MNVKKKILTIFINLISIVCIGLVVYSFIPVSYFVRHINANRQNFSGFYDEKEKSLDMVYIGGSAAFVYWEPLRAWNSYGFTSYNFAHNSIVPQAIKYYIEEVEKTQSPNLYLIDLRPFQYGEVYEGNPKQQCMYTEAYIRNGTDSMNYSYTRYKLINEAVKDKEKRLYYHLDFFKYKSRLQTLLSTILLSESGDVRETEFIDNIAENRLKGFSFIYKTAKVKFTDHSSVTEVGTIDPEVHKYFIDLLEYCKEKERKILFIVHSYVQTKAHKMEYNYMKEVIEQYGFDFLNTNDYYKEIGLDYNKDLYNNNHVNVFGAEKYTDFVAKYIDEKYNLPDKRGDEAFSDWNTCYDEFVEKTNYAKRRINKLVK